MLAQLRAGVARHEGGSAGQDAGPPEPEQPPTGCAGPGSFHETLATAPAGHVPSAYGGVTEPEADAAFVAELKAGLPGNIRVIERDTHIEDPAFATEAARMLISLIQARRGK